MLRLMDIQCVRESASERVYLVTLDRDGKTTRHEFIWKPPSKPDSFPQVYEPVDILTEVIDYQTFSPPGQPQGAFLIPPLFDIIDRVYDAADGKSLDFPIVLDEH